MFEIVSSFIDSIELPDSSPDWHAVYSIQLCELIEEGFDIFGDEDWPSLEWYSSEVRTRLEKKIVRRYYYREIGITPPGEWRHELTRLAGEALPKCNLLYATLADMGTLASAGSEVETYSGTDSRSTSGTDSTSDKRDASTDDYDKHRDVTSDFPATQLDTQTQDYARDATDHQGERIGTSTETGSSSHTTSGTDTGTSKHTRETLRTGNYLSAMLDAEERWQDVDKMFLDALEPTFSCMFSVSMNAF